MKRTLTTLLACAVMVSPVMATDYTYSNNSEPLNDSDTGLTDVLNAQPYTSITFEYNDTEAEVEGDEGTGGAILSVSTELNLHENGSISFSYNTASSTDNYAKGGALYTECPLAFNNNTGSICFSSNGASGTKAYGGAIYTNGITTFTDNKDITFTDNTITGNTSSAEGGAIMVDSGGTLSFTRNGIITFSDNKASGFAAVGGAIVANGKLAFTNGNDITFSGNAVSGVVYAAGGAVGTGSAAGNTTFNSDGLITFRGNTASGGLQALGGAIYTFDSTLTIQGSALFEKNVEVSNGTYRLRSIYAAGDLNLSASTDKSIEFRDSIYSNGTVNLNGDGETTTDGTIRFTGATTAADLAEMKGSDGTDTEITNSRTSELTGEVTLYSGKLAIEDEAVLNITGSLATEAGSSIEVSNGAQLCLSGSGTSEVTGAAALNGGKLTVEQNAVLNISKSLTTKTGSSIEVSTGAQLNLVKANTTISSLTLGGGTLTLGTEDDHTAALTTTSLTVTDDSALNADLVMSEGTLTFSEDAVLTMGCSVTIGDGVTIVLADEVVSDLKSGSFNSYDLMDSVEEATVGNNVTITSNSGTELGDEWTVKKTDDNKLSVVKTTPEPATATLSLLALAGLAARRRRK